ncbi:VanZ family protein [Agrococcus terreus]|uniref:VanZ family protein n=1 Tax=Agrococcus terreus TaxID=574649 RepID=UPI0038500AB6
MAADERPARARRRVLWMVVFALALVGQLAVLYSPVTTGDIDIPFGDKVVHAIIFAVPAFAGVLGGLRPWAVAALLVAHSIASESIQHFFLADRMGDWGDAVADVVGVAIGLALALALQRRSRRRDAPSRPRR